MCSISGAQSAKLPFGKDGSFKVVQIADLHYSGTTSELAPMCEILDMEKPDLVIFTGDNVTMSPLAQGLDAVLDPLEARKIPFVYLAGNHDTEFDLNAAQISLELRKHKGCVALSDDGITNYSLALCERKSGKPSVVLYCMDSHGIEGFTPEDVAWFKAESGALTAGNGGWPLPALAFFHAPLPIFEDYVKAPNCRFTGVRGEAPKCQKRDSGMWEAISDDGGTMGLFFAHDHYNSLIACMVDIVYGERNYQIWGNLVMGYGARTGGKKPAARVYVLHEGERYFASYVRTPARDRLWAFVYPDDADVW